MGSLKLCEVLVNLCAVIARVLLAELLEHLALVVGKMLGHDNLDLDDQSTRAATVRNVRRSQALAAELLARLRTCGDVQLDLGATRSRNLNLASQRSLGIRNRHRHGHVGALALE